MALIVFIAGLAYWNVHQSPTLPNKPRIAVLAFDDFSAGEDKGYLSDALAEGVITELARFDELSVIARASSFHYRKNNADIGTISEELRANYVLALANRIARMAWVVMARGERYRDPLQLAASA